MRVELRQVSRRFGRARALAGVSLEIPRGRRLALIGPNGSGKSTLTRIVMGLLSCEGEVLLDGRPPFEDRVQVARRLGYVPQVAPQLSASVGELVQAVCQTRGVEPQTVVRLAGRLELDLEAVRGRALRNLSGGMKQKVLIALAFAAQASLLILDEPTASLDAAARERFFELFEELPEETTLVLCSHRLEEMRHLAHHVVELADGQLAYDGPIDRLLAARGRCVVEVCVDDARHAEWMRAQGFRAGAPGWWVRTYSQAEKMQAVPLLTRTLGGGLRNLLVRDLETIEAPAGGAHHA